MIWYIDDKNEYTIEITDTINTWLIPKFRIEMEVEEPYLYLYWNDRERGDGGSQRLLKIDYRDVVDGYTGYVDNPSSATDLETTIEGMIVSGFAGGGGDILTAKADLLSHDGVSDTILPGGSDGFILKRDNAETTGLKWVDPSSIAVTPGWDDVLAVDPTTNGNDATISAGDNLIITDATASRIAGIGASKEVLSLDTATYPSLTELSYVKGVTSAIQTQLNGKYNVYGLSSTTSTPLANGTRYFGNSSKAIYGTSGQAIFYFLAAGTIIAAEVFSYAGGTVGSNEAQDMYIRINNTTDYLIATVSAATAARYYVNTGLSIAVTASDYAEIKWVTNALATAPTNVTNGGNIFVR